MEIKKNYYYNLEEYVEKNNLTKNEESLFLFLQHSIRYNSFIKDYISYILYLNRSFTVDDIISESYLKSQNVFLKKQDYTIFDLRNVLRDLIKYSSAQKRKCTSSNISKIQDFILDEVYDNSYYYDIEDDIINKLLSEDIMKNLDKDSKNLIFYYFFKGYTYSQISELLNLKSKRGIKKKLDKILVYIKYKKIKG